MSGPVKRDHFIGVGLAMLAVFLAFVLVFEIGHLQGREAERRNSYPHTHAQPAQKQAEKACVGMDSAAQFECVYQSVQASEETARTEQDLTAQQESAWGVMIGTVVAFVALAATIVGLYYVRRTLLATLEAVKDTGEATVAMKRQNDLAEAAQRAWVDITLEVKRVEIEGNVVDLAYEVVFTNIGKSIAESLWTFVHFDFYDNPSSIRQAALNFHGVWWHGYKGPSPVALMPGESYRHLGAITRARDTLPWVGKTRKRCIPAVLVAAHYNISGIVGFNGRRRTDRVFRFGLSDNDGDPLFEIHIWNVDRVAKGEDVRVRKVAVATTN